MPKTRTEAVLNVKSAFLPAERSAESAAAQGARCIAVIIEERKRARLPFDTAAEALDQIVMATNMALESRKHFIAAHRLLAALPAAMGVEVAYGPDECPPNSGELQTAPQVGLRAVA